MRKSGYEGMGYRTLRIVLICTICLVPLVCFVLYIGLFYGAGIFTYWHQDFAANGVAQIPPAAQIDGMYDDCRHYITYGRSNVSIWNSVAYFGGRYELTMQVPVQIDSSTKGRMIGEPQFYLLEVSDVTTSPSGQISASFSRNLEFGPEEWNKIVEAGGDFGAIEFKTNTGPPIKDFEAYAKGSR